MNPTASLAPIAAALLVTGVHASDTDPRAAPVWQVAIAHDFRLTQDDPPVHLYPPTTLRVDGLGWLRTFRDDTGTVTWNLPVGHSGNDGLIAWGRWGHGRTGGDGRHGGLLITGGEGVRNAIYYVAGAPLAEAPAGAARYSVLGGQVSPTAGEGGMAATTFLENGVLQVNATGDRATLNLAITVPSGRYDLVGQDLHIVEGRFVTTPDTRLTVTGALCFAGCTAYLEGFLAGPDGARAGLAYHIDIEALTEDVNGVVAWHRD